MFFKNTLQLVIASLFVTSLYGKEGIIAETSSLCRDGDGAECYSLGALYLRGAEDLNVTKNVNASIRAFSKSCLLGKSRAKKSCSVLGVIYSGYYGEAYKNSEKALLYFGQACVLGAGEICAVIGAQYEFGDGVTKSPSLAKEYYLKGCMRENDTSCDALELLTAQESFKSNEAPLSPSKLPEPLPVAESNASLSISESNTTLGK